MLSDDLVDAIFQAKTEGKTDEASCNNGERVGNGSQHVRFPRGTSLLKCENYRGNGHGVSIREGARRRAQGAGSKA